MKQRNQILLLILLSFSFKNCCCRKECQQYIPAKLIGFSKSETDSIELIFFEKGSQFQKKTGNDWVTKSTSDTIELPLTISSQDLEIRVIKTNAKFQFSDYIKGLQHCNLCTVGYDDFEIISELKVNGNVVKTESIIELKK
jgi:hypothetical protein